MCSTTLWVGHLSKLVYQEELSDTFGSYGDIVSIDQIVPRGCAFIVMNRRQDAYKAMQNLRNHKLQGRVITISWAAGKGVKSKEWKDFWDLDVGVTFIPWNKLSESTDFDSLEEGGMFDEDSMPPWLKEKLNKTKKPNHSNMPSDCEIDSNGANNKNLSNNGNNSSFNNSGAASIPMVAGTSNTSLLFGIDTTQPPPRPPQPPLLPLMPGQFSIAPPLSGAPRMLVPPLNIPLHMPPIVQPHPPPLMMMPTFNPMSPQMSAAAVGIGPPPLMPPIAAPPNTNQANMSQIGQFTAAVSGKNSIPPPPPPIVPLMSANIGNINDESMDIEMEDSDPVGGSTSNSILNANNNNNNNNNINNGAPIKGGLSSGNVEPLMNYNVPPPAINLNEVNTMATNNCNNDNKEGFIVGRDCNRGVIGGDANNSGGSVDGFRWNAPSNSGSSQKPDGLNEERWQGNGNRGVGSVNMDMLNVLQRPDCVNRKLFLDLCLLIKLGY